MTVAAVLKLSRFLMPTIGAAAGAGAYVMAGGKWGGTAFLLIMHCGMLVGWVAQRMIQSAAFATGHLDVPCEGLNDDEADALIDAELARRSGTDGDDEGDGDMVVTT